MAIKRYVAAKDNTITNAFNSTLLASQRGTGSNMGAADVLEIFSIYGQASGSNGLSAELFYSFLLTLLLPTAPPEQSPLAVV